MRLMIGPETRAHWLLGVLLICGLAAFTLSADHHNPTNRGGALAEGPSYLLLDSASAQIASIGYGSFVSSLLWVDAIFEHVDAELDGAPRNHSTERLGLVILLDPKWEEPYHFAGLTLEESDGRPSKYAIRILEDGVVRFPQAWKLRVYLGMGLLARGDTLAASTVMAGLAQVRGRVPPYIRELAITYAHRKGGRIGAIQDILLGLQIVEDPIERLGFIRKLAAIIDSSGVRGARDSAQAIEDAFRSGDVTRQERWGMWLASLASTASPESGSSRSR